MTDEPRFLRSGDSAAEPGASGDKPAPQIEDTPERRALLEKVRALREQREVLEAELTQRLDEHSRKCIGCDSTDTSPAYVLVNYGSHEIARRYSIVGTVSIQSSTLAPSVSPMCERCYARVAANRQRHRIGAAVAAVGIVIGMGYFVAALAKASTAVSLGLLFGGGALMALAMVHAVFNLRSLHHQLKLPKLTGMAVLLVTRKRDELERLLDRCELNSRELQSQIDRKASDAAALPAARIHPK
ncbi:MAG TPA: hypothetical protein VFV99_05575 [Kofleriaceae bacterium]|nr:hypothetical protein [Kofleriaceae bacterium]